MFVDRVKVRVKAGDGGHGCVSFRREKYVPKGGPDGGDGGDGGNVIFRVHAGETTLIGLHSKPYYQAERGEHGRGKNQHGQRGKDIVCQVPPGTLVLDSQTGEPLFDLTEDCQEAIVAQGGRGGRGNARYATATRQAPRKAQSGLPGEDRTLLVELKIIAQAGLVGLPNAGKSTLINQLTHARARVGDYPFTTLSPVIGTFPLSETEQIILADIPGIIEGAHKGAGLGLDFLRHIERTRLLVFVIDCAPDAEPVNALKTLRRELGCYQKELLKRPWILALNKIDLLEDSLSEGYPISVLKEAGEPETTPWCMISGKEGMGLDRLTQLLRTQYHESL